MTRLQAASATQAELTQAANNRSDVAADEIRRRVAADDWEVTQ